MTPKFDICKVGKCGITVTGYSEYQDEDNKIYSLTTGYAFSESVTLNIIEQVKYDGTVIFADSKITEHYFVEDQDNIKVPDTTRFELKYDGLYEVTHMIIPTIEWFNLNVDNILLDFENIIIYDKGLKYYKNEGFVDITAEELAEINLNKSTILKCTKQTFSLCNLQECYINLCKDLLQKICPLGNCADLQDEIKQRDLVWMALNVIHYNIELKNIYEAQRILEWIMKCGTVCSNYINGERGSNGCGCGR